MPLNKTQTQPCAIHERHIYVDNILMSTNIASTSQTANALRCNATKMRIKLTTIIIAYETSLLVTTRLQGNQKLFTNLAKSGTQSQKWSIQSGSESIP